MEDREKSKKEAPEEELSLEELSEVTGGIGLRHVKKEETHDISTSVKERV